MSIGQRQRKFLNAIAAKLEHGEPLTDLEREWAAGAVRAFAGEIPDEPKRTTRGAVPRLDALLIRVRFALLRRDGVKPTEAIRRLAVEFNSGHTEAIRKIVS